eukprot:scpid99194/ scgid17801/ 
MESAQQDREATTKQLASMSANLETLTSSISAGFGLLSQVLAQNSAQPMQQTQPWPMQQMPFSPGPGFSSPMQNSAFAATGTCSQPSNDVAGSYGVGHHQSFTTSTSTSPHTPHTRSPSRM